MFLGPVAWVAPDTYLYAADGQIWQRGLALTARYPVQMFAAVAVTPTTPGPPPADLYGVGPHPARGISRLAPSPDERQHVFSALGDIWLSTQQGALRQLTDDAYLDLDPSFAEDGDTVVFASDRAGSLQLWRVSLADNAFTALTSGPGSAYFPTVAPGGRHVAFLRTRSSGPWGHASLELLDLDNNTRSTLATDLLAATRPTWSEDGAALSLEALSPGGQGNPGTRWRSPPGWPPMADGRPSAARPGRGPMHQRRPGPS